MIFPTLDLRNNVLINFLSVNFLVFLSMYHTVLKFGNSEGRLLIIAMNNKYVDSCKTNFIDLILGNNKMG